LEEVQWPFGEGGRHRSLSEVCLCC
jgi:hypothetical protein